MKEKTKDKIGRQDEMKTLLVKLRKEYKKTKNGPKNFKWF